MNISYILCNSAFDRNIYPDNRSSDFSNIVTPFNGKSKEIGLLFLTNMKSEKKEEENKHDESEENEEDNWFDAQVWEQWVAEMERMDIDELENFDLDALFEERTAWNMIKVIVEEIDVNNNHLTHDDKCVFMTSRYENMPVMSKPTLFYKLQNKDINRLHISVRNEFNEEITNDTDTIIKFQIRDCSPFRMKYVQLVSNSCTDLYPTNTPVHFMNIISEQLQQNIDFRNWEVALHSIFINTEVLEKFGDALQVLNVYTNVEGNILMRSGNTLSLEDIPINFNLKGVNKLVQYVSPVLHFHPIERKTLDKIIVRLQSNFLENETQLNFSAEERKNNVTIIKLCLKEKLFY